MSEATQTARRLHIGTGVFVVVAATAFFGALVAETEIAQLTLFSAASALVAIALALHAAHHIIGIMARRRMRLVMTFLEHDSAAGFCTDGNDAIIAQNKAGIDRFGPQSRNTLSQALETAFANPDSVVHRLRALAETSPSASEDVATRHGHVRVAVQRTPGGFLWRLEDLVDREPRAVDGAGVPVLTVGPNGAVLHISEGLHSRLGRRAKRVRDIFEELPLKNGFLNRIQTETGWENVRVVLSEPVSERQDVFILPANDNSDGRVALDTLPVALLRLDAKGRVVFANRSARDLLPNTGENGEACLAAMVEGLGRSIREWVAEAAAGRGLYRPEIVRVSGVATETFLQITLGRPLEDGEGGLIAVLNDATELKTMEAQFVQSQKMQAIGQLAGGVAHDFNNLLTAISGHCDLLLLRHQEGEEDHADLTQITQNANRAAALVGQLLAFSRKQTLEMQQVDLRDTLGDLTHLLNRLVGERVQLRLEHDPALIPIRGDRRQLEQVLMNLVVNARDAMPDGGEILIDTQCRYLDKSMTRDRVIVPAGQYVVVTVSDEGMGIAPDKLQRIFEPFFTTKRPGEGTGLGLSMAYGIVKQSGGYIFADSRIGEGASFSLYFPAAPEAVQSKTGAKDARNVHRPLERLPASTPDEPDALTGGPDILTEPSNGAPIAGVSRLENPSGSMQRGALDAGKDLAGTQQTVRPFSDASGHAETETSDPNAPIRSPVILLVEDEAPVRAFASRALRLRGYSVLEAANAEDALDVLEDTDLAVDMFLTDVIMPGMDGPSWVRKALEVRPTVRTVFMSGYVQDAMSEASTPVPNAVFLPKPFSLSDLTRTVERALA